VTSAIQSAISATQDVRPRDQDSISLPLNISPRVLHVFFATRRSILPDCPQVLQVTVQIPFDGSAAEIFHRGGPLPTLTKTVAMGSS
jgi:hypothetical protein